MKGKGERGYEMWKVLRLKISYWNEMKEKDRERANCKMW